MKTIAHIFFLLLMSLSVWADNKIGAGLETEGAKTLLDKHAVQQVNLTSDVEHPKGYNFLHYMLEERVILSIRHKTDSEYIDSLSVTFLPDYRPAKGIDISRTIEFIEFSEDGDYTIKINKNPTNGFTLSPPHGGSE